MAGFGGLAGLAFVPQGYDEGADAYWRRQNAETNQQIMQLLGRGLEVGGGIPGSMPISDIPQPAMSPPSSTPVQPQSLIGLQPGQQPLSKIDLGTAKGGGMPLPLPPPTVPGAQTTQMNPRSYISEYGGYGTIGGKDVAYGADAYNPDFSQRLEAAGQAFQRETGQNPKYGQGDRDAATQARYWEESGHGTRYPTAPPGQSHHQTDTAMDMPPGTPFTRWLQAGNAQRFGLGFPVRNDPNHIQLASGSPARTQAPPSPGTPVTGLGGPLQQQSQQWQSIVNNIIRANPGAPPAVVAGAVLKAIPLMTMMSQMDQRQQEQQWRAIQLGLEQQRLDLAQKSGERADERLRLLESQQSGGAIDALAEQVKNYEIPLARVPAKDRPQVAARLKTLDTEGEWKGDTGYNTFKAYTDRSTKTGQAMVSLGRVQLHLGVLRGLYQAQQQNDTVAFNRLRDFFRQQTGSDLPTNVAGAIPYVASEMVRAATGIPGSMRERVEEAARMTGSSSPQQMMGLIDKTYGPLLEGQRQTEKGYYERNTGRKDFDMRVLPKIEIPGASAAPTGGTYKDIPFKIITPGKQSDLERGEGQVMSDVSPEPVRAGQHYAMADEPPPPEVGRTKPVVGKAQPMRLGPQELISEGSAANQRGPAFHTREEDVNRLLDLMAKGKNQREIAQELGIGERTVRRFQTEQLGTQQKSTEIQKDPELIKQYKDMVKKGWSLTQMARKLDKNEGTVSRQLKILNKSGDIKWTPEGGTRTPSMPTFKFKDKPGEIDEDYIKSLEKYLKDIQSYYKRNSAMEDVG